MREPKQGGTVEVRKWPVEAKLTESILDNVQSGLRARDFGVFLYSPGVDGKARDNVVFETGLCLGMKDAAHTVLLLPKGADVTPSDLRGIIGIEYPYKELENADYTDRLDKLDGVGARIVEKIYNIMAETSPNQEQPGAGQPRPDTSTGQPSAALEMFNAGWTVEAALGRLRACGRGYLYGQVRCPRREWNWQGSGLRSAGGEAAVCRGAVRVGHRKVQDQRPL